MIFEVLGFEASPDSGSDEAGDSGLADSHISWFERPQDHMRARRIRLGVAR